MSLHSHLEGEGTLPALKTPCLSVCLQKCAEMIVAHLGYLNYTKYTVIVGFEHLKVPIKKVDFTVSMQLASGVFPAPLFSFHSSAE